MNKLEMVNIIDKITMKLKLTMEKLLIFIIDKEQIKQRFIFLIKLTVKKDFIKN